MNKLARTHKPENGHTVAVLDLANMSDKALLDGTVEIVNRAAQAVGLSLKYLTECQRRFDNRGKGQREICGYVGFTDFIEKRLGKSARTIRRWLLEAEHPEKREERILKQRNDRAPLVIREEVQTATHWGKPVVRPEPKNIDVVIEPEPATLEPSDPEVQKINEKWKREMALPWAQWGYMLDIMNDSDIDPSMFIPIFEQIKSIMDRKQDWRKGPLDTANRKHELADNVRELINNWVGHTYMGEAIVHWEDEEGDTDDATK
jgi:hypothetical protein